MIAVFEYLTKSIQEKFTEHLKALRSVFDTRIIDELFAHYVALLDLCPTEGEAMIISSKFHKAEYCLGVKWADAGRYYKTDLVIFIDTFAVIIEAKSGRVHESALRGADGRMRRHFKELFIEPNIQSTRFMNKLQRLRDGLRTMSS